MPYDTEFLKAETALIAYGESRYMDGIKICLFELEKVHEWLTKRPDNKRPSLRWVCDCVEAEIKGLKSRYKIAEGSKV